MKRRRILTAAGGAALACAWAVPAAAQTERLKRVGIVTLWARGHPDNGPIFGTFDANMERLGWREGVNYEQVRVVVDGDFQRVRAAFDQLVAQKVDGLLAHGDCTAYGISATGSALTRGTNSSGGEVGVRHLC